MQNNFVDLLSPGAESGSSHGRRSDDNDSEKTVGMDELEEQWSRMLRWRWQCQNDSGEMQDPDPRPRTPTEPSGEGALPGLVRQAEPQVVFTS